VKKTSLKRAEEIIKDELAKTIEAMNEAKKQAKEEEWLDIEEATLTLLRAARFIIDKLDDIEKTIRKMKP